MHLFPQGLPVRDPFPMAKGTLSDGETILLFVVDFLRLDDYQYDAIANLIAQFCKAPLEDVEAEAREQGGFAIRIDWVDEVRPGLEGLKRITELVEFKKANPNASAEQWMKFFDDHKRRWIDEIFDPVETSIKGGGCGESHSTTEEVEKRRGGSSGGVQSCCTYF